MTNLDTLPAHVYVLGRVLLSRLRWTLSEQARTLTSLVPLSRHSLLSILEHFPDTYKEERIATVEWPFGPKESCRTLVPELIALGATNRQLRHALLPTIFADQNVGQVEPTKAYASKVVELSEGHGEMLACIRNLTVVRLLPRGIEALAACIGVRRSSSIGATQSG